MTNSVYQQEVIAPDGTKLKAVPEMNPLGNCCHGCYFEDLSCIDLRLNQSTFECSGSSRQDGRGIIWIKSEAEMSIKTAQQKKKTLEKELMKLVNTFEEETGLRVKDIHNSCSYEVGGTAHTYHLEVDVDFT